MSFSEYNSSLTFEGICEDPESQYFERKGRDTKPSKLADSIIEMLNANGGVIAFGVHDGVVEDLGQLDPNKLNDVRRVVHDLIQPPANVICEEISDLEWGRFFLFHIEQDYERLFSRSDNERVFLRVADSNKGPLSREQVKQLEYNKTIRSFEEEVREDFDRDDFTRAIAERYLDQMRYDGSFDELLVKRNLAKRSGGKFLYKNAAVLMFARDPEKYIPNASVRYVRYKGTESRSGLEYNVIKDERFEGCIPVLIKTLDTFINASLRDYYFLNMEDGVFQKISEYPKEAWLEGIVNALCHRSYNFQGNSIYLKHYDDRLEISNSGPLPAQVTVENIEHERYARNPRIARTLSEMGFVRELNEGVPRIYRSMRQSMLAAPEYKDDRNIVTLILRNRVSEHKETIHEDTLKRIQQGWRGFNKSQREMIRVLFECQEASVPTLMEKLGLSETGVRYNLGKLEAAEILERNSEKKAGYRRPLHL